MEVTYLTNQQTKQQILYKMIIVFTEKQKPNDYA